MWRSGVVPTAVKRCTVKHNLTTRDNAFKGRRELEQERARFFLEAGEVYVKFDGCIVRILKFDRQSVCVTDGAKLLNSVQYDCVGVRIGISGFNLC